ncbi:hypothetical protein Anas_00196 [Armadillidium nasatum]|uniref:Uncharacterized protein n=1 Tax=Armadillidium nasatum TaxID=96803 RepID=A0A5N5TLL3_9CRUS|nr:hypothetical protein Anas_00196 [Armadillidium nasatum]
MVFIFLPGNNFGYNKSWMNSVIRGQQKWFHQKSAYTYNVTDIGENFTSSGGKRLSNLFFQLLIQQNDKQMNGATSR